MSNNSSWPIHRTLSGAANPGQFGPGSDGNEGVIRSPQSFRITAASSSDCLESYLGDWGDLTSLQRCSQCILRPQPTRPVGTWERWQWRSTPHSPKLQHNWIRTIRWLSDISRILVGEGDSYTPEEIESVYSIAPADCTVLRVVICLLK